MRKLWKQFRYRLESLACRLVAEIIPLLPRGVCLQVARVAGIIHYQFDGKARAVALENLRLTLGNRLNEADRKQLAKKSYQTFARTMLDLFWARNLLTTNFDKFLKLEGFEHAYRVRDEHGSIIFLAIHHGGHEWVHLAGGFAGFNLSFVALDFKNSALESVFRQAREHSGNHIVGQQQSMLKLLRAVRPWGRRGRIANRPRTQAAPTRRGDRRVGDEDVRHFFARFAARTDRRADGSSDERTSRRRHLHGDCAPSPHLPNRSELPRNHTRVLGFL